jgi:uncharacterized protein HemX
LEQRCGGAEAAPAPTAASPPPAPVDTKPALVDTKPALVDTKPALVDTKPAAVVQKREQPSAPPRWSTRGKVATVLLAAGAATGVTAGIVYWWNDDRYDQWRAEDQRLMAAPTSSPMEWVDRQRKNDELWQSIERVDTIDKVLAGAAVSCLLGSAILGVVFNRPQTIEPGPGGVTVTWRWR